MKLKHKTPIFLGLGIILLVFTAIDAYALSNPQQFRYGPVLWAEKLSTKPEKYIVLADPDAGLLEALSNPSRDVFIGSWDNTSIDELVETYQTYYVEYIDAYYKVHLETVDVFIYNTFSLILISGWVGLIVSFLISLVIAPRV